MTDQNKQNDEKETTALPPQTSTPSPPPSEDKSSLLSPWWSEKPIKTDDSSKAPDEPKNPSSVMFRIHRTLEIDKQKDFGWEEKCYVFTNASRIKFNSANDEEFLTKMFDQSKDCTMVCFLRETQRLTRYRLEAEKEKAKNEWNPFHGLWIFVAKTPKQCKEHIFGGTGLIRQENSSDYYNIDLGKETNNSGEHVTRVFNKTIHPLQHLSQKYIDSWTDGTQQAFFTNFWTRLQGGDAFYLVKDYTKRLIENILENKKPSDKE